MMLRAAEPEDQSVGHFKYVLVTEPTIMEVVYSTVPRLIEMLCSGHGQCQKHCAKLSVLKQQLNPACVLFQNAIKSIRIAYSV